jgi:hypothetical protein
MIFENFATLWNFLKKGWCSQVEYINFRQKYVKDLLKIAIYILK